MGPLVPPLVPLSPAGVASPVVGVSECAAREGDTTVQQNRTEKRRGCFGRSNNYYSIFLSSIQCELRTRLVSLSNPKIYIYAISSNYHVVSFQSNKYLCLSYIYRRVQNYYTHTTKSNHN